MNFAAHIRESDGKIQTVKEHCEGTADLAQRYAEKIGAGNFGYISAKLHDFGKMTKRFDQYIRKENSFHRGEIDHSYAGAKYICEIGDMLGEEYYEVSRFIARVIVSHHGLHDWIDEDGKDYLEMRVGKSEDYSSIVKNVAHIITDKNLIDCMHRAEKELSEMESRLNNLARKHPKNQGEAYAFYIGMLERLYQSILIDADRTDTAEFILNKKIGFVYDAETLFGKLHDNYEKYILGKNSEFSEQNEKIVKQRNSISDRCAEFSNHDVGICQLIVPTGGGKTLSSLRFAIEYCRKHEKMERIFYIAPFISILEQNSNVIREVVGADNFLEHHSNIIQESSNEDELKKYELYAEKWDVPVIATTMVQFLNTLFQSQTTSVRRMHSLCKSVIIIDEIQSLPLKCVNMFHLAINFLREICGSTIVLCSATQPDYTAAKHPIFFDENFSMTGDFTEDFEIFRRTQIIPCVRPEGYTYEQTAEFCYEKYQESGNLLVIANTKKSVLNLYYKIIKILEKSEENVHLIHLSTNMCPKNRKDKINELKRLLIEKKHVICISTQLIEAGVDISFQCVIRFLAGMENVAQAAGRCNRNAEIDRIAPVYIINVQEELGNLKEIRDAQAQSGRILGSKNYIDYLSVDTMRAYFRLLYKEEAAELSYQVKINDSATNLLNLLSKNSAYWGIQKNKKIKWHSQAFKTAGSLFEVIDKNAVDVIVPYDNQAEKIIKKLRYETNIEKVRTLLRKAQNYTVSVYCNAQKKYDDAHMFIYLPCGAIVLKKEFYDKEIGVKMEEAKQEILMY